MKLSAVVVLLSAVILALFALCIFCGTVSFSPSVTWDVLCGRSNNDVARYIIIQSRLPQAVTALMCGASLAVCGLLLQTIFSNPLADPSILGINAGASLGVAIVMLLLGGAFTAGTFALGGFSLILGAAFLGAVAIIVLLLAFSRIMRGSTLLLILGIMVSYLTSSLISLLNYCATSEGVHSYIVWGLGNFSGVSLSHLPAFVLVSAAGLAASVSLIKPLNALLLGERYAENLGFNVRRLRTQLLLITGVLTAITTAYCGPISFIGLAVPHMARLLLATSNHRSLLPVTLLCGAAVALLCNFLSTLPGDQGLIPLNVLTPLFGVPVIVYVLAFRRGLHEV